MKHPRMVKLSLLPPLVSPAALAERFSVAPMVGHTHRHTRYFLRLLSRHSWLYTEMMHAEAVVAASDGEYAPLWRGPEPPGEQGPVALQLGGRDPRVLAEAAAIGKYAAGYNCQVAPGSRLPSSYPNQARGLATQRST